MKEPSISVWLMDIDLQAVGLDSDITVKIETMRDPSARRGKVVALDLSAQENTPSSRHAAIENLSVSLLGRPSPSIRNHEKKARDQDKECCSDYLGFHTRSFLSSSVQIEYADSRKQKLFPIAHNGFGDLRCVSELFRQAPRFCFSGKKREGKREHYKTARLSSRREVATGHSIRPFHEPSESVVR